MSISRAHQFRVTVLPIESLLMTSTSLASFSDRVPDALSCGGGESIAAIFFLFFPAKKLPKKPVPPSDPISSDGLAARGGPAEGCNGFPVFGSTCVGLAALCRSLTIAIACTHKRLDEFIEGVVVVHIDNLVTDAMMAHLHSSNGRSWTSSHLLFAHL